MGMGLYFNYVFVKDKVFLLPEMNANNFSDMVSHEFLFVTCQRQIA